MKSRTAKKNLGMRTHRQVGQGPAAEDINLLVRYFAERRYAEAETLARVMTQRYPSSGIGWKALGVMLKQMDKSAEALAPMQEAARLLPGDVEVHNNLGVILKDLGNHAGAEAAYRKALAIKPDYPEALNNLGVCLYSSGKMAEAERCYLRSLQIRPEYAEAYNNYGIVLQETDRLADAETCYRRALQFKPDYAGAYNNLGNTLQEQGRLAEAEACYRRALGIDGNFAEAHNNLGKSLNTQGRLNEAEASYKRALQLDLDFPAAHSNLLFLMNYVESRDPAAALAEARRFGRLMAERVTQPFGRWHCPAQPAPLRVGFVSGDFRRHPVGFFFENILASLDRGAVQALAYPTNGKCDELTARLRNNFYSWRPIGGMSDRDAAQQIHDDGIHVLVDLSGHTLYNRLPLFAWKPAPVQVSWLGYFATTGVAAMDYLLADPYTLPVDQEAYFTEKIWRLPATRLCFTPPDSDLPVSPLPALTNGHVTFGCFNNLAKLSDEVVELWSRLMAAVPDSKLFLKAKQLGEAAARQSTVKRFADRGIDSGRLILEGFDTRANYLAAYHRVDMALDPFPYPGGTTSVEGLWMGVPVLTMAGKSFLARQGVGIAMNAGLADWVAADTADYFEKAVSYAGNLEKLSRLRQQLRPQVLVSPLFDARSFAANLESALRDMWLAWCQKNAART